MEDDTIYTESPGKGYVGEVMKVEGCSAGGMYKPGAQEECLN